MINNDSILAGYLTGTIKGQLDGVEIMRAGGMSDKIILEHIIERLKFALDNAPQSI